MRTISRAFFVMGLSAVFVACGGDGGSGQRDSDEVTAPVAPTVTVDVGIKQLIFSWHSVADATYYRLLENPDGHSGFTQVGSDIPAGTHLASLPIAVHLHDFANALYIVEACNSAGCTGSSEVNAMNRTLEAIGYFKASNSEGEQPPRYGDHFGAAVALSADGRTMAVGAWAEDSAATGVDGDQSDNSAKNAGAVYVFRHDGNAWEQQAYIKASNTDTDGWERFGWSIALSADGNSLAVGARTEDSTATGINGDQDDDSGSATGAVYVFRFNDTNWSQQAYIKASNTGYEDYFGHSVSLSADGNTLVAGAPGEDSGTTGINGDQSDNSELYAGAAYVFRFDGVDWYQQAYIKASNADSGWGEVDDSCDDEDNYCYGDFFGVQVSLSDDGNTLAVGAHGEDSAAAGINGDQSNTRVSPGAAYVFRFDGVSWSQQAYIKASNPDVLDNLGESALALSGDGNTLVVGVDNEDSNATGIDGNQDDNSAEASGAVYVFRFDGINWSQQAYIKASNTEAYDRFGEAVALSTDGSTLAVGAILEGSSATGINGDQSDNSFASGAVYLFRFDGSDWLQDAYVKAPNVGQGDRFGSAVALNAAGTALAVGAWREDSAATGVNGDQSDNSAEDAGAAYLY